MPKRRFCKILCVTALLTLFSAVPSRLAVAQDADPAKERLIVDRFLKVLLRQPAPGTALDRVYTFHVQEGTINTFLSDLRKQAAAEEPETQGRYFLLIGLVHQLGGDAQSAIDAFKKAESLRAEDYAPSFHLGKSLNSQGETDKAAEALQRAIDRKPPRILALQVYSELGRLYQRSKQSEKALKVWQQLESAFPGDARVSEKIARTMYEEGDFAEALKRYENLAKRSDSAQDSRAITYQVTAAELKKQLGRTDEALADFESLLTRLRPSSWLHSDVRQRIESVFLESNNYVALSDYYAKQVEKRPADVELKIRLGRALLSAGRLNDAKQTLQAAVKTSPTDATVRMSYVDILNHVGDGNEAAKQLQVLVDQEPENPDYLVQLGNAWLQDNSQSISQRRTAAAKAWQKLADVRKDDPVATAQVADLMRRIERKESATELYRRAIELAPDQPQYREYLGQFLFQQDRKEEALAAWQEIAAGPRKNRDNLVRLAEVLSSFQLRDKAIETFTLAAEMDLMFVQRMRFAQMLMDAERYDESLAQLDLAQPAASTNDEREQLLRARMDVYVENGSLEEQIAKLGQRASESNKAEDYRQHAMLLSASGRKAEAIEAINAAIAVDPGSVPVLVAAAELFRDGSRYVRAIEIYEKLNQVDQRFSGSYLRQISTLQLKLGNVEGALAAAQQMIDAAPGSSEPMRFYAEQCFAGGRYEKGIQQLRETLRLSPDDNQTRLDLARTLAYQYRTDESIKLFWQALSKASGVDDKQDIVRSLAYLYDRSGDFPALMRRLDSIHDVKSDVRAITLQKVAAYEAIYDLAAARKGLQTLLEKNPSDADVLERLVKLSIESYYFKAALEYQQRLVQLADTPENRRMELMLLVECGKIQEAKKTIQQSMLRDEDIVTIRMIDRLTNQNQPQLAISLCRSLLDKDDSLWEVQSRLALLYFKNNEKEKAQSLADRILDQRLPKDTPSQLSRFSRRRFGGKADNGEGRRVNAKPISSTQAMALQVAMASGLYPVKNSRLPQKRSSIATFQQARFAAIAIKLQAKVNSWTDDTVNQIVDQGSPMTNETERLWLEFDARLMESGRSIFASQRLSSASRLGTRTTTLSSSGFKVTNLPQLGVLSSRDRASQAAVQTNELERLAWEIAAIDDRARPAMVGELMSIRYGRQPTIGLVSGSTSTNTPLDADRLQILRDAYEQLQLRPDSSRLRTFATSYYRELKLANKSTEEAKLQNKFLADIDTPEKILSAFKFASSTGLTSQTQTLLFKLQAQLPDWSETITAFQCDRLSDAMNLTIGTTATSTSGTTLERKLMALDLLLSLQAIEQKKRHGDQGYLPQSQTTRTKVVGADRRSKYVTIATPNNSLLLSSGLANRLYPVFKINEESSTRSALSSALSRPSKVKLDDKYAKRERQLRGVASAYVYNWMKDNKSAAATLDRLSKEYPEAEDLAIESARMHMLESRYDTVLTILDSIDTKDHRIIKQREMIALQAAINVKNQDRALSAAQHLFAMNLSQLAERSLLTSLTSLGEEKLADSLRQRIYRRGNPSVEDQLEIGNAFLSADNKKAAAEVASSLLRRLAGSASRDAVKQRSSATLILTKAGRLVSLVSQSEQRARSSPNSFKLQSELAELYSAMGRDIDAIGLYQAAIKRNPAVAKDVWAKAKQLYTASDRETAGNLFLLAFREKPELLGDDYSIFVSSISSARKTEDLFIAFSEIDSARMQPQARNAILALANSSAQAALATKNVPLTALVEMVESQIQSGNDSQHKRICLAIGQRAFADDQAYSPEFKGWSFGRQSSTGVFQGLYYYYFTAAQASTTQQSTLKATIQKRLDDPKTKDFAEVLSICSHGVGRTDQDLDKWVQELIKKNPKVPTELWWQIAVVLNQQGRIDPAVTIMNKVRDRVATNSAKQMIGNQLSVWQNAVGNSQQASTELLMAYATLLAREKKLVNRGDKVAALSSKLAYAVQFQSLRMPLEGVMICNEALNRDEFPPTNGRTREQLIGVRAALIGGLSTKDFTEFLSRRVNAVTSLQSNALPNGYFNSKVFAGLSYAILEMAKSENGRVRLRGFDRALAAAKKTEESKYTLLSIGILIDLALKKPGADKKVDELTSLFPNEDQPIAQKDLTRIAKDIGVAHIVASVALRSSDTAVRGKAEILALRIIQIAKPARQFQVGAGLCRNLLVENSKRNAAPSNVEVNRLREIFSNLRFFMETSDSGRSPKLTPTEVSLELAEVAARHNLWQQALQCLAEGFADGKVRTGTVGETVTTSVQAPLSGRTEKHADVIAQMLALIKRYPETIDAKRDLSAYENLCRIVFPMNNSKALFPYLVPVVDQASTFSEKFSPADYGSVAEVLVSVAVRSGNENDLQKRLQSFGTASEKSAIVANVMSVQLAAALHDEEELRDALQEMSQWLKPYAADAKLTSAAKLNSVLNVGEPKHVVDAAIHAIGPLKDRNVDSPELIAVKLSLLKIAANDPDTSQAASVWTWLTRDLIEREEVSDSVAGQAVEACFASTKLRSSATPSDVESETVNQKALKLLRASMINNRALISGGLLRQFAEHRNGFDLSSGMFSQVSLDLLNVKSEDRLGLLQQMVLGSSDDPDPAASNGVPRLLSPSGIVLYAEPPAALQPTMPFLANAQKLSVADKDFPVTSAGLFLADTAVECSQGAALVEKLEQRIAVDIGIPDGGESDAILGLALLAKRDHAAAAKLLALVGERLKATQPVAAEVSPMPMESILFLVRCSHVESLRSKVAGYWPAVVNHATHRRLGIATSFFHRYAIKLNVGTIADATTKPAMKHWIHVQLPYLHMPVTEATQLKTQLRDDGLHMAAGSDHSVVMLKYPIVGNFTFQYETDHKDAQHATSTFYQGTTYTLTPDQRKLTVRAGLGRNSANIDHIRSNTISANTLKLSCGKNEVDLLVNDVSLNRSDARSTSMPFIGIDIRGNAVGRASKIAIGGNPVIPRSIDLLEPQLRGWTCALFEGQLNNAHLPYENNQFKANIVSLRKIEQQNAGTNTTWYVADGVLQTGSREEAADMRHLQYARPILEGESVQFQLHYDPKNSMESHPTVGRTAVLIRDGQLKLRWIRQRHSAESFAAKSLNEVALDAKDSAAYQLKPGQWNDVVIKHESRDVFAISINGTRAGQFTAGLDQRFGFLCEKDRKAKLRSVSLMGPWPEKLPDDLLAPSE